LLLLTENLAALPSERYIIMKAYYTPDCPTDYTPQYFNDASDPQTESDGDSDVDAIKIGDIETQYHKFSMRFAWSILFLCVLIFRVISRDPASQVKVSESTQVCFFSSNSLLVLTS
jgi:hypothetical protein